VGRCEGGGNLGCSPRGSEHTAAGLGKKKIKAGKKKGRGQVGGMLGEVDLHVTKT